MRTIVIRDLGRRRRQLRVTGRRGAYQLQWANPTEHGHHYEPPCEGPFTTRKEADEQRRAILNGEGS